MIKNFQVTVNGNAYVVAVEELMPGTVPMMPAVPVTAPQLAPATPAAAAPAPTLAAQTEAPSVAAPANAVKINAPMPGAILDIKAGVGDKVSKNQAIIILEAMKMENEIVSPVSGVIASINVSAGATVNSGDILFSVSEA